MTEPLLRALTRLRSQILDDAVLVRAVASGTRRGSKPRWRRAELRYVDLKAGRRLQVVTYDATQAHTKNYTAEAARAAVDDLLDEPFGSWHVEATDPDTPDDTGLVHQLRVTKSGEAQVSTSRATVVEPGRGHDREKERLLPEDDPLLRELGISTADGRVRAARRGKYRQVEEFLRLLAQTLDRALSAGHLRTPTAEDPLRVVDLGCGNAYLTLAAHRYLDRRGLPARLTGVDRKTQALEHNRGLAERLLMDATFVQGSIAEAEVEPAPEVVLALHACDTATDEALARAVGWRSPLVLAAPCCHHDMAAQLRRFPAPTPYEALTRDGILRERFADTLTDAVRAALLRGHGYRVDVVEFVPSEHTPRNTLIRAVRTGASPSPAAAREYDDLIAQWRLQPRLATLLEDA